MQMHRKAEMTADSCLVLYGNSVFLAGIKAELERNVARVDRGRELGTRM